MNNLWYRWSFMLLVLGMASCGERTTSTEVSAADKPNILWFISEDNSPYLGIYGNSFVHTPTLDSLAAVSVLYENAYSNAPVCAPSRSGIITGVLPVSIGTQHMRSSVEIPAQNKYYVDYLKEKGYYLSLRKKRDYNIAGREEDAWDEDDWWDFSESLNGRAPNQPFYMFYNTWQTHEGKLHGPEEGYNYFKSTFGSMGQKVVDSLWNTVRQIAPSEIEVPAYLPDIPEVRQDLAIYYSLMQAMDIEFNHMLNTLRKNGELENTIIIYSSDHGGVMARSKRFAMETGLKVPLYIWFPEKYKHLAPAAPGTSIKDLVTLIDVPPTILEMAGIATPEYYHGTSLLSSTDDADDFAFGFRGRMDEAYDMVRTIRQGDYRYTINFYPHRPDGQHVQYLWKAPHLAAWEAYHDEGKTNENTGLFWTSRSVEGLYNIVEDPYQVNNLAQDPSQTQRLESMRGTMTDYLLKIGDLGFIPEGVLYEKYRGDSTMYIDQYSKEKLDSIILNGIKGTLKPDRKTVASLIGYKEPAIRFWAAMAAVQLAISGSDDVTDLLSQLAEDEYGDVRAMAAEGLFHLGEKEKARDILVSLLDNDNQYVVIRALGIIDFLDIPVNGLEEKLVQLQEKVVDPGHSYVDWLSQKLLDKF